MRSGTNCSPSTLSPQWYLQQWSNGSYTLKNNAYNSYLSTTTPNSLLQQQSYVPVQQSQTPYFWLSVRFGSASPYIFELVTRFLLSKQSVDDTTRMFSSNNDSIWYIPNTNVGTQVSSLCTLDLFVGVYWILSSYTYTTIVIFRVPAFNGTSMMCHT